MVGAVLSTALAGLIAGAAQADAVTPIVQPDQGRGGIGLSHDETAAVADGPLPALLTEFVPSNRIGAGLRPDTQIYHDPQGRVHASMRDVVSEAAQHSDGSIAVLVNVPGSHGTRLIDVYQRWG
ncbi:MAG: hypothetical protein J2P18_14315 [Nocardia sp.]|nr:hypothetical protein [Nocardia sp.]